VFTDTIYYYTKGPQTVFNYGGIRVPLTKEEITEKYFRSDEKGRFYDGPMIRSIGMGERPNLVFEYKGYTPPKSGWRVNLETLKKIEAEGNLGWSSTGTPFRKLRPDADQGKPIGNIWNDISLINSQAEERVGYPTQKPQELLERIIRVASNPSDLVFDCFMGSGTTQVAAMKLGRRFIGADINLGAIQTTTKRLLSMATQAGSQKEIELTSDEDEFVKPEVLKTWYTGFSVFNVNYYDIFRNPIQAKELLIQALEIQPLPNNALYDGEKDGRMVKIMPVNRIATKADINDLLTGFDYKAFQKRREQSPSKPVESLMLVCMGHEPDLAAHLKRECHGFDLDVEVVDILRDKANLEFKRDSEAEIKVVKGVLKIAAFYPMNLLQKLSLMKENVKDWRELTESVMIDWNYDGAVFEPKLVDVPEKESFVKGEYAVPKDAGTIRVKITDLLSESLEMEVARG
jgi:site-specific DNA-methyltransferase (adenine-specific)/adenine-specific DNA-methyltransferase